MMFIMGKFWCCYQAILEVEYKLGRQSVLEIHTHHTQSRLCTGCGRQFRFAFMQEDDISYRGCSTIRESVNTIYSKNVSALASNYM